MILRRLRMTLLMVLSVVAGLGISALWLVRFQTSRLEALIEEQHRSMMAANTILFHANMVIASAMRSLHSTEGGTSEPNNPLLLQSAEAMHNEIANLRGQAHTPIEGKALAELDALIKTLLAQINEQLDPLARDNALVPTDLNKIADTARNISQLCQRLVSMNDTYVSAERKRFDAQFSAAASYVIILSCVALLILGMIYWQFNSLALRPLARLTESVREVGKRNFELSLPVRRDDEIGKLSQAYNEMATELRRLYRETDLHILDLNARNRALLSAFPHAVLVLDDKGKLLQINPEAEKILDSHGTPDRLPIRLRNLFDEVSESREDYLPADVDEALLFRLDGREYYYLPRVFNLPPVEDTDHAWGIILTDVTRFRWLSDMKLNVLATASHEIKTPLTGIRMVLHLLLEEKTGTLTPLQKEMVGSASDDCERLLETLDNLLQLGRLQSGSKHLNLKPVPPTSLFENIPLSLRQAAAQKSLDLKVLSNGILPLVCADQPRIAQVVNNLLSNAIRFSPEKSTITLQAEKCDADHVRLQITDQGPGVPAEAQNRLFDRFFRAPGQKHDGTGLGLSISREIIEAHSGRIGFRSSPGHPTTFYFDLPIA